MSFVSERIQKNLEPMYQNIEKKKYAQDCYYSNHCPNISPLKRASKGPVHERLGINRKRRRMYDMPYGTNTSLLGPKRRTLKTTANTYTAQNRLHRIKQSFRQNKRMPRNLLIKVPNIPNTPVASKKFKMLLNPTLQSDIRLLQSSYNSEPLMCYLEDFRPTSAGTGISTNDRFTQL